VTLAKVIRVEAGRGGKGGAAWLGLSAKNKEKAVFGATRHLPSS